MRNIMPVCIGLSGIALIVFSIRIRNKILLMMGLAFLAAAVYVIVLEIKDRRLRKLYEQDPEEYERRYGGDEELTEEEKELEQIEKYDVDSDKGYCPHCGNYSVSENRCEACGEKVTE